MKKEVHNNVIMSTNDMAVHIYTILTEHDLTIGEALSSLKKVIKLVRKSVYYDYLKDMNYKAEYEGDSDE